MKHLLIGIVFATLLATVSTVLVGCRQGEKGEPGPSGTSGQLLPYKSGSITGTLSGISQLSDAAFTQNLNFQYFKGPTDNAITTVNYDGESTIYNIARYDSVGGSYIKFKFSIEYYDEDEDGTDELHLSNASATIVSTKKLANSNDQFYFSTCENYSSPFEVSDIYLSDYSSGSYSNLTVDNLTINNTTGLLTFDYSLELAYHDNSTGNNAYMDGTVSITPYNVSYRQGSAQ